MRSQNGRVNSARGLKRRRGVGLVYGAVSLVIITALCSLAVDLGAAQLAKTQLQRAADATAHDYIQLYNKNDRAYADQYGPSSYNPANNPVNLSSGAQPTYNVVWGWWDPATKTFSTSDNGGNVAVKVIASCSKANGNAVPLLFASVLGVRSVDITATSIAMSVPATTKSLTIDSHSDLYFAGMPSSTTGTYGDDAIDNAATQVQSIPVVPGSVLTFTNTSGTTSVCPGSMPDLDATGASSGFGTATHHGVSWDGSGTPTSENGIADAIIPESSLVGMFLDDSAPNLTVAPATVDWTTQKNNNSYTNLQLKAPFYIGDGKTSGGTVQQFTVPPGATRFYIGVWDGLQFNNNAGSLSVTVTSYAKLVQMVK
jgi:Flp pilus assembly protein TadG